MVSMYEEMNLMIKNLKLGEYPLSAHFVANHSLYFTEAELKITTELITGIYNEQNWNCCFAKDLTLE